MPRVASPITRTHLPECFLSPPPLPRCGREEALRSRPDLSTGPRSGLGTGPRTGPRSDLGTGPRTGSRSGLGLGRAQGRDWSGPWCSLLWSQRHVLAGVPTFSRTAGTGCRILLWGSHTPVCAAGNAGVAGVADGVWVRVHAEEGGTELKTTGQPSLPLLPAPCVCSWFQAAPVGLPLFSPPRQSWERGALV